jgi:hypothetical protein
MPSWGVGEKKRRGGVVNVKINGFENEIGVVERE